MLLGTDQVDPVIYRPTMNMYSDRNDRTTCLSNVGFYKAKYGQVLFVHVMFYVVGIVL